jgi:hypothetical protein
MAHANHAPRDGTARCDRRVLALAAALCVLPACAKNRARPVSDADRPATNAGLASLANDKSTPTLNAPPPDDFKPTREIIQQYAALYDQIWANAEQSAAGTPVQAWEPPPGGSNTSTPSGRSGEAPGQSPGTPVITSIASPVPVPAEEPTRFSLSAFASDSDANTQITDTPDPGIPEMAPGPAQAAAQAPAANPEQRKQQLLEELVGVLGELALSGDGPGSSALALAGLEAVRPDALSALKGQGVLSEAEIASLDAARDLFRAMTPSEGGGGIADPGEVSAVLDRIRRELDARAGLRILRAELCTSVTGFGRYETFPANRFIAGRAQPVIVYTEIDRFGHRASTGNDGTPRYEIELSQRLELYHVADNLNTWNRAAEMDKTVSRNLVRDYYLINQVTLPANLSIGKYHLKVVMRDLVSGNLAETIIPIEIVAGTGARSR